MPHGAADLTTRFQAQHAASRAMVDVPLAWRRERLGRIAHLIETHGPALADAVQADFGVRSPHLTDVADYFVLLAAWPKAKLLAHRPRVREMRCFMRVSR